MNEGCGPNPRIAFVALLFTGLAGAWGPVLASSDAANLMRATHLAMTGRLEHNQFHRPLVLDSIDTPRHVAGEIYAEVNYPFSMVSSELNNAGHWCDVISLHINTKYCRAETGPAGSVLKVSVGQKGAEKLSDAYRVEFGFSVDAMSADYAGFRLIASDGPMGTSDYRIALEAIAVQEGKTFLHLTYSYAMNFTARIAMQTYLATLARDKIGFTRSNPSGNETAPFIGGLRALVERNTMRYYLAIDSFLDASGTDPTLQLERRLESWFSATELYAAQLHEMDRSDYLSMKRDEYKRQQSGN